MPASERLRTALAFSEADLLANRAGECSQAQRERLRREHGRQRRNGLIALLVRAAIAAAAALGLPAAGAPAWPGLAAGAALVGVTALSVVRGYAHNADLRKGRLRIAEGRARLRKRRRTAATPVTTYHLKIGESPEWTVAGPHWKAFRQGEAYRVAYARMTGTPFLLSAEELSEAEGRPGGRT